MRIDPQGDFNAFMSQSLLDHMDRDAGLQEERRTSMPEPMELDGFYASLRYQPLKFPLANAVTL